MYKINEDLSIYVTRGDIVLMSVSAEYEGRPYTFVPGDVVRMKVFKKKKCTEVALEKDFPITAVTQNVQLFLSGEDTKIGEVISKPVDYWYEVELNPLSDPQTIIGYDEDGAKVFKLFPEGADKELEEYEPGEDELLSRFMDDELDLTSTHPVENQVIARAIARIEAGYKATQAAVAQVNVTPEMYGAIGDGVADDTKALQECFKHNNVNLGNKTYVVSGQIELTSDMRIAGNGATIIDTYNGKTFYAKDCKNIHISGINFSGTAKKAKTDTYIIRFENCENVVIDNIKIDGCYHGLMFSGTSYVTVRNSVFCNGNGWVFSFGPYSEKYSHVYVENNECYNCEYDGIKFTGYVSDVVVTGNKCHDNARDGFDYAGHSAKDFIVCQNIFSNNNEVGIDFKMLEQDEFPYTSGYELYYENIVITDNIVDGCYQGINGQYYYDIPNASVVISNNNITNRKNDNTTHGVRISPCNFSNKNAVKICNNNIDVNGKCGVRLQNSKNVLVESNIIRANFEAGVLVDKTMDGEYGNISVIKNHFRNIDGKNARCFYCDDSFSGYDLSSVLFADNLLENERATAYLLVDKSESIIFINNVYVKETFMAMPTGRVTKNVIYKSANPAATNCTGWLCKESTTSPTASSFLQLT